MIINKLTKEIEDIACRIKSVREDCGLTDKEVAAMTDMDLEDYQALEEGRSDITFSFIYKFARICNIEITAIIDGRTPKLADYTLTRKEEGMNIYGKHGVVYEHLAPLFKNRLVEPFLVTIPYSEEALMGPKKMVTHRGQELNIVVKGTMKKVIGDQVEILHEGDSIYHDSSIPHDETALGDEDLVFYAFVMDPDKSGLASMKRITQTSSLTNTDAAHLKDPIYEKWINTTLDEKGIINGITFNNENKFNFAFDVVDVLGKNKPDKRAMLYVDKNFNERTFTFGDMSRYSSMTANYFESLGIKKGDRVMLVLKRHYHFWYSMMALHKIGAIAIPATNLLMVHDYVYRFKAAGVKAIIATDDDDVTERIDEAEKEVGCKLIKVAATTVNDPIPEGWHDFNNEFLKYSDVYERKETSACGNDLMVMFFTSGTTGNPKLTAHCHKYALGHFITAKYWQNVVPDGLHFTMSETGWGKSLWGKLYGQWLCEAGVFTYDFDKFESSNVLPMFAKYDITTFCAPPTIYRFFIKEDLSKYDLSSVRYAAIAGEALNPEVYSQWIKATGVNLVEAFGQTETTLVVGNLVGGTIVRGSMGKPSPLYDVDIVDLDGNPCKDGETGEIVIRTDKRVPCGLFKEYYGNEEKTKEAWHDNMYHTGDTAWHDENGYYWYVGRIDDVIKSSGYRIGPFEIESVIMELPYVLECAVTGAPDPIRGQVVKANIVLVPGKEKSEDLKKEIQQYVKTNTAPYKYPRIVEFFDELPKTISGKIKRTDLRKMSSK